MIVLIDGMLFSGGFPGCQPVSMDLNNINLLQKKPYKVSWKADGTRSALNKIQKDILFFVNLFKSYKQFKSFYGILLQLNFIVVVTYRASILS